MLSISRIDLIFLMYTKNSETELKMYPYHKQMKQKLTDNDKQLCVINNSRTDVERVPYSPDLDPPDFYIWGYLKDRVYQGRSQTIDDLKNAIATNIKVYSGSGMQPSY